MDDCDWQGSGAESGDGVGRGLLSRKVRVPDPCFSVSRFSYSPT
jgi:hypothetical protein